MVGPTVEQPKPWETPFRHEALLYKSETEFLDATVAFIREGIEADEPVLVVLPTKKNDALRGRLGAAATEVRFEDMMAVGANPAWIIPTWREFATECSTRGLRCRGIGEPIWAGRDRDELVECHRHEALLNLAFADTPGFRLLCPYDDAALAADVVAEARRNHPLITDPGGVRASATYRGLRDVAAPFDAPLPEPPGVTLTMAIEADTLPELRSAVRRHAEHLGLPDTKVHDLVCAANEIATNTIMHGGGGGTLRLWHQQPSVICEVRGPGRIVDPLAGRVSPPEHAQSGRGLWLATQLCDLVQIRARSEGGIVRLHMRAGARS